MKVTLLNHSLGSTTYYTDKYVEENSEHLAGIAAAICVDKFKFGTDDYSTNLISALSSGHLSILEHLSLTFLIEDISRATSHQLVRHKQFCVA